jgi:L-fucose/D-arabinose isomerase
MRTTPIGLVMLNDERPHVYEWNNPLNIEVLNKWADVIRSGLKAADGSEPEVIIGSKTITSARVAQEVGEELSRANVKQLILCYNVWNFPFLVWPLVNSLDSNIPILNLSNNDGEFPGNVGLLATDGALRQTGRRTHRIVGDMNDAKTQKSVFDWIRAAETLTTMRNEVFGIYGGHSMGMETGYFHLVPTIKALGTTARQIDQLWLVEMMKEVSDSDVDKGFKWFGEMLGDRILYGGLLTEETLKTQIRLYCAMQMVNEEKGFDFCGLKGQREMTEYVCLGDVPEMILNDPYDWNGPKEPFICSTEADAYGAITMQMLKYISGGLPSLFMDVRLYLPEQNLWDWCNSGNHASWYAARSDDPRENFDKVHFHPAMDQYFKAGGASVEFDAMPGEMTFARLGVWDDKLFMVIARGDSVEMSAEERKAINELTAPTWPHVHARLKSSFEEFLTVFPCNHVLGVIGDKVQALNYLCEISGIKPIILGEDGANRVTPIWERMGE